MLPPGARRFAINGSASVPHGHLWEGQQRRTALLVHGWGADSGSMYGLVAPLLAEGFRVGAFDGPAHGASPGKRTNLTEFVNAADNAISALEGVDVVIAHSLGGIAAIAALARRVGRGAPIPSRVVLLSAPRDVPTVVDRWSRFFHVSRSIVARIHDELTCRNGVPACYYDIAELGRSLDVAALVIHDHDDPLVPFSEAMQITGHMRNTRLHQTAGLGHRRILFSSAVHRHIVNFLTEPAAAVEAPSRCSIAAAAP
jgi:acyl-lipid omega-6 desaturase (Delta-12 desaturase)